MRVDLELDHSLLKRLAVGAARFAFDFEWASALPELPDLLLCGYAAAMRKQAEELFAPAAVSPVFLDYTPVVSPVDTSDVLPAALFHLLGTDLDERWTSGTSALSASKGLRWRRCGGRDVLLPPLLLPADKCELLGRHPGGQVPLLLPPRRPLPEPPPLALQGELLHFPLRRTQRRTRPRAFFKYRPARLPFSRRKLAFRDLQSRLLCRNRPRAFFKNRPARRPFGRRKLGFRDFQPRLLGCAQQWLPHAGPLRRFQCRTRRRASFKNRPARLPFSRRMLAFRDLQSRLLRRAQQGVLGGLLCSAQLKVARLRHLGTRPRCFPPPVKARTIRRPVRRRKLSFRENSCDSFAKARPACRLMCWPRRCDFARVPSYVAHGVGRVACVRPLRGLLL